MYIEFDKDYLRELFEQAVQVTRSTATSPKLQMRDVSQTR